MARSAPSRALVIGVEAVPGPAQFKLRTPQAISLCLGSECLTAIGWPNSHRNTSKTCSGEGSARSRLH
eukprot:15358237-Alexandrium_andersonii.AAC.1